MRWKEFILGVKKILFDGNKISIFLGCLKNPTQFYLQEYENKKDETVPVFSFSTLWKKKRPGHQF